MESEEWICRYCGGVYPSFRQGERDGVCAVMHEQIDFVGHPYLAAITRAMRQRDGLQVPVLWLREGTPEDYAEGIQRAFVRDEDEEVPLCLVFVLGEAAGEGVAPDE